MVRSNGVWRLCSRYDLVFFGGVAFDTRLLKGARVDLEATVLDSVRIFQWTIAREIKYFRWLLCYL